MNTSIKEAMLSALGQFASVNNQDHEAFSQVLVDVFSSEKAYLDKVASLDAAFDDHSLFESLRELFFDLLL
ncbi:MAG: hypothetical protein HQ491_04395, partial [Bacteroidetes bacterium]|nr:hypothetical protein [Bacteroidota bacterium]